MTELTPELAATIKEAFDRRDRPNMQPTIDFFEKLRISAPLYVTRDGLSPPEVRQSQIPDSPATKPMRTVQRSLMREMTLSAAPAAHKAAAHTSVAPVP